MRISLITACYNSAEVIADNLESMKGQVPGKSGEPGASSYELEAIERRA